MLYIRLIFDKNKPNSLSFTPLQELQTFVNRSVTGFSSPEIEKSTIDFLNHSLKTVSVVTCKFLQLLPQFIADEIYHTVLSDITVANCNQFLAILMNGKFSAELIGRFEVEIFPKLIKVLLTHPDINQHFKLCLAFANDDKLRDRILFIENQLCADDLMCKRRMFVQTVVDKLHFVDKFIRCDDVTRSMLSSDVLRRTLFAVKLLQQSNDHTPFVREINQLATCSTDNRFRWNLFNELQRLLHLNELFSPHIPNTQLTSYACKFNVIDMLHERVDLSKVDKRSMRSILEENRKYNQRLQFCGNETVSRLTELELYNNFLIVKLLVEVIMDSQHVTALTESSVDKLHEVRMLLGQIDSVATFTNILEVAFSLTFIRWDNVNGDSIDASGTVDESGSETTKSRKCSNRSEKTAFICSAVALDNILDLLKNAALETSHSNALVNAGVPVRKSFLRLQNNIDDAHWRVAMFCTNSMATGSRSTSFVDEDVRKYFARHKCQARANSNGSSDDESGGQRKASVCRRKPRKKNPLRKSIDDKNLVISNSTEHEQRSDTLHRSVSGIERRCPVSRMLGSPEHLATVCLNNGNFGAAKEIVEVREDFFLTGAMNLLD